jgi:hypothetical protein
LLSIIVATGLFGWIFFRSDPFLFSLVLLAGYNAYSGWRAAKLKEKRQTKYDVTTAIVALTFTSLFVYTTLLNDSYTNTSLIYATTSALFLVVGYDLIKYFWLYPFIQKKWVYEHIYKVVSTFSALLSALAGNTLREYQPMSQLAPSIICLFIIGFMMWRHHSRFAKKCR